MSGEKTEQPTSKRRNDSFERGEIPQSRDFNNALLFLPVTLILIAMAPGVFDLLFQMIGKFISFAGKSSKQDINWTQMLNLSYHFFWQIWGYFAVGAIFSILVIYGIQNRFSFSSKRLKFSPEKLDPVKNLQNMFSMRQALLPIMILGKSLAIFIVGYVILHSALSSFLNGYPTSEKTLFKELGEVIQILLLNTVFLLIVLGGFDYGWQWLQHEKKLKMSKQEVKDETKQEDGSPEIKQKRRQKMHELSQSRTMEKVPEATVIITNPTHYAVAIKYIRGQMATPEVVAKGKDLVAKRIRSIATENNIPLVENKPLARSMYRLADIGKSISPEFFQAVATVLAYVYKQKKIKR